MSQVCKVKIQGGRTQTLCCSTKGAKTLASEGAGVGEGTLMSRGAPGYLGVFYV